MQDSDRTAPGVKSAVRTVELLDFFARQGGMYSLADIQQALGYPKSSLYALLRTLVGMGWVETDPTGTLYRVGMRALLVGASYVDGDPIVGMAYDTLDWLAEATGEAVQFGRLDDTDVVFLSSRPARHNVRPIMGVGRRLPANATATGKALLAERAAADLPADLEAVTELTLTDREAFLADLAETRARGYAIERGESVERTCAFGVTLRLQRPARDAISVSIPAARMAEAASRDFPGLLMTARERIEYAAYHILLP
jgi:DNA-binding IclR family transcriptional regulator